MRLEDWRNDPSAQKKTWIAASIVAVMLGLLWLPSPASVKQLFARRRRAETKVAVIRPVPADEIRAIPIPATPHDNSVSTPASSASAPSLLAGIWSGMAALPPQHGMCKLALELNTDASGTATAYSTLACQPPATDYLGGKISAGSLMGLQTMLNPTSAIMTGTTDANGVLHLKVTKNVGVAEANHGCSMASAEATPFGGARLAFEWHEENCPGGQMLLVRAK